MSIVFHALDPDIVAALRAGGPDAYGTPAARKRAISAPAASGRRRPGLGRPRERADRQSRRRSGGGGLGRHAADIGAAVDKWRAVRRLTTWAARRHAGFRITPDDGRHRLGEKVGIEIARPLLKPEYLTIVNLVSDGRVQFVFPDEVNRTLATDLIQPREGFEKLGEVEVTHPVGADHVVATLSAERPVALHEWLEGGGGERTAEAFVTLLRAMAAKGGRRIGVTPIFTTR